MQNAKPVQTSYRLRMQCNAWYVDVLDQHDKRIGSHGGYAQTADAEFYARTTGLPDRDRSK